MQRASGLVLSLVLACTGAEQPQPPDTAVPALDTVVRSPAPDVAGPLPDTLAPVAADVALQISARPAVRVGESLDLELRVRNGSGAPITVVRPVYGSWEHARQPDYRLEWTDERGATVLDPLGFAPGLECGVLDPIVAEDRIHVAPGGEQRLGSAPAARPQHLVLASARPGTYKLRVRYLGLDIPGATPLHLLSEPVPVTIRDGDVSKWACRAKQVAAGSDYQYIDVAPARLVPAGDGGFWLVFSRYIHTVRRGVADPGGDLQIRKLGPDLTPTADAIALIKNSPDEIGHVSVAPAPRGLLVVFTPGPVGGRSVQTLLVDTRSPTPTAGAPRTIQPAPGNPYVTSVAALGDRVAVLHDGPDRAGAPLMLTMLDASGAPLATTRLATMATQFSVQTSGDAVIATWLQRGEFDGGMFQRLDRDAVAKGPAVRFTLDPSHSFAGVRHHAGGLDVAYADSGTRGDDPRDLMGLYRQSFSPVGQPLGRPTPLSPESRTEARFGAVTWLASNSLIKVHLDHGDLILGRDGGEGRTLATSAAERLVFEPFGDRAALLWASHKDDTSAACLQLHDCAPEVYGALIQADGAPVGAPVRLTHGARPRPLLPSSHDWQRHCP